MGFKDSKRTSINLPSPLWLPPVVTLCWVAIILLLIFLPYNVRDPLLMPIALVGVAVLCIDFWFIIKGFKFAWKESLKVEAETKQELPAHSWGRAILISAVIFALIVPIFWFWKRELENTDIMFMLLLPITVLLILKPLSPVYLQKKLYPITRNPLTKMDLLYAEQNPEGIAKFYRAMGAIFLAIVLIYLIGRLLGFISP